MQSSKGMARSHCRFILPLKPDSLTYSVPLLLKRQCDRTLGEGPSSGPWGVIGVRQKNTGYTATLHNISIYNGSENIKKFGGLTGGCCVDAAEREREEGRDGGGVRRSVTIISRCWCKLTSIWLVVWQCGGLPDLCHTTACQDLTPRPH
jgi:hypothetical protein